LVTIGVFTVLYQDLLLIWRNACQARVVGSSVTTGKWGSAEGGAGLAGARRAVRLMYAGQLPQDRVSSGEPALL
jgi:hypothetical protein